jgi:hypothetical protein
LPGNDDNDLDRTLREEPVEVDEETTPAEGRWFLNASLALALVAAVAALAGVGSVSNGLRSNVLDVLEKARDSSTAALDSSTGALRSIVGASVGQIGVVASKVGEVPSALGGDVVGALQQARDSSTAALRSAVGEPTRKHFQNGSSGSSAEPFRKQYGTNVFLCLPNVNVYVTRSVSARSVPSLVSKGAIYPVPPGGCS